MGTGAKMATWAQFREPVVQPLYESRSDVAIIFDLATRLALGQHFFDGDIQAAYNYELSPLRADRAAVTAASDGPAGQGQDPLPEVCRG